MPAPAQFDSSESPCLWLAVHPKGICPLKEGAHDTARMVFETGYALSAIALTCYCRGTYNDRGDVGQTVNGFTRRSPFLGTLIALYGLQKDAKKEVKGWLRRISAG